MFICFFIYLDEGITADVTSVTVRDGTQIDLYTCIFRVYCLTSDTPSSIVNEKDPRPHQLVFFCHGGGWVMANRWSNEPVLCKYALQTNSVLTYVNYRLAPEFKHPTAVYDCYDCLKFLLEHKTDFHIDDKQVILMGDSAGGMICFSIAQLARDEVHRNLFKKMVLIYPAMDNRKVPDDDLSWDERNMIYDNTFGLQYKTGEIMSRWYFPSWDSVNSPLGSPIVCEDFTNFPPVRIFTCEYDALKIAAREVAEKMRVGERGAADEAERGAGRSLSVYQGSGSRGVGI